MLSRDPRGRSAGFHTARPRRSPRSTAQFIPAAISLVIPLTLLSGCASPTPQVRTEQAVGTALGLGNDSVLLKVEGGETDEPIQQASSDPSLSLASAVRTAVLTDPELQAALARVRMALADADQARLLPNPILNLVLRFGDGSTQVEASLAEDFVAILQQRRKASAADNRLRRAAANAVTTALDTVQTLQEQYAAAQKFDRLVPVLEQRTALVQRVLDVARARLEAGEGARPDVTILDSQRVELEVELAEARLDQRAARLKLARLIGVPSDAAAWTLDPPAAIPDDLPPEAAWVDAGLAHRPEIRSAVWELAALGDDAALARLFAFEGTSAGVDAQRDDGWAVGPAIATPVPIFDLGQARRARVTAEMIEARHTLTLAKRRVVEEVRVAYQELAGNRANLKLAREQLLPLQQRRRDEAEAAFRAGQSDITLLFLAEQDLRTTQARIFTFEEKTAAALARLHRAVGGAGIASRVGEPPRSSDQATTATPAATN